jgi:hypothetical protein
MSKASQLEMFDDAQPRMFVRLERDGDIERPWHDSLLTRIEGVPARDSIVRGMAHFAGGGPIGATCNRCAHFARHFRQTRNKFLPVGKCGKFAEFGGDPGQTIDASNSACKYFADAVAVA